MRRVVVDMQNAFFEYVKDDRILLISAEHYHSE